MDLIFGPYVFQPRFGPYIQNTPKYAGFCVFGLVGRLVCFYGTATEACKVHRWQITAQEHTPENEQKPPCAYFKCDYTTISIRICRYWKITQMGKYALC